MTLKEGNVEYGSIVVDKLEEVDLQSQGVVEAGLGSVELLLREPDGDVLVNVVEYQNQHQVDGGSGHRDEQRPVAPGVRNNKNEACLDVIDARFIDRNSLNVIIITGRQSQDHGHPVEDDGDDCDHGEGDEEEDAGPGHNYTRQLHPPERRLGLRGLSHEVDCPLLLGKNIISNDTC